MDGEISPDDVSDLLASEADVRVVDIRDPHSFRRGHIPGSENVPFRELTRRIEEFEGETRVVTVCPHGKASVQAARLLGSYEGCADATVESMHGGLEAWANAYELVGGPALDSSSDADETATDSGADETAAESGSDDTPVASEPTGDAPF